MGFPRRGGDRHSLAVRSRGVSLQGLPITGSDRSHHEPLDWSRSLIPTVASLHGSQNAALLLDRFAFGMLASCLVILTGGLEAGIAAHIVNNVGAYSIAALTSSVAQLRATQEVTWADALTNLTIFAVFALAATAACRLLQLPRTTNYPLAQPNGPVAATRSPR